MLSVSGASMRHPQVRDIKATTGGGVGGDSTLQLRSLFMDDVKSPHHRAL